MQLPINIILATSFFVSSLSLILAVLAILFGIFLMTVKTKNRLGNILLGLYFIIMAMDFSAYYGHMFLDLPLRTRIIRNDIASFLSRPLIYLYVLSVIYSDFKLKSKHLLHTFSFILVTLITLPWYFSDVNHHVYRNSIDYPEGMVIMHFSHAHTQFYLIAMFLVLRKYKQILLENYSNPNLSNYKWLMKMTIMLQLLFMFTFVKNMVRVYWGDDYDTDIARICLVSFVIIFLCWVLLKALHAPEIFRGIRSNLKMTKGISIDEKQNLEMAGEFKILKKFMLEEMPYLNPELTIQDLAIQLNKPTRELSVLINNKLDQHFYEFINTYRIEKAKELLKDSSSKDLTISEILYQVGFNSKSSFYTTFKKQVGCTPKEYREKVTVSTA